MPSDPALLLHESEADPDDVRSCLIDERDHLFVLLGRQLAKWRRVRACADEVRIPLPELLHEELRDTLVATVEEVAPATWLAVLAARKLEDRSVTSRDLQAVEPTDERHTDSVAHRDVGVTDELAVLGHVQRVVHRLRVRDRDVMARVVRLDRRLDRRQDLGPAPRRDG